MEDENQKPAKKVVNHLQTGGNIILLGAMGSGKTTVGWLLSRLVGFGFVDLDERIEKQQNKTVNQIFADQGESKFRHIEKDTLNDLKNIRSHVIAVGGGAVVDDENWDRLRNLGVTIYLETSPEEIARRLTLDPEQLEIRPLLNELTDEKDMQLKRKLLAERMSALIGSRIKRYREADLALNDAFSTPESSAKSILTMLIEEKYLDANHDSRHFDKWETL